jgi:hypothetical protein
MTSTKVDKACINDANALVKMRIAYLKEDGHALDEDTAVSIEKDLLPYFQEHMNKDLFAYVIRAGEEII